MRRIEALAEERLPAQCLLEGVAHELSAAMPVDALILAATDPDTLLGIGAGVVHDMPHTVCAAVLGVRVRGPRLQQVL